MFVASCSAKQPGELKVHDAWIKEAPPGMDMLAGYMDVENTGDNEIRITQVTSTAAGEIMMHKTEIVDGVAKMTHLPEVIIAPHSHVLFQPEGNHLMIMGVKQSLKDGDHFNLQLHTADGKAIEVTATVRRSQ
ncbi:MAG: copper chaperone PCu(A)C [Gammaproteobacteria bacterium]